MPTNEKPLIAHCSDLEDYYIKYHKGVGMATRLFNEYLVACMLPLWGFNCSEFALIKVLPEHIPDNLGINKKFFETSCFGIKKIGDCVDLTENNIEILSKGENKKRLKDDILKLCFLDIFIANEDRHLANLNTLAKFENSEWLLYPIDHVAIFNQHGLKHPLIELTFDESIVNSALFSKIVKIRDLPRSLILRQLKKDLYLCVENTHAKLDEIIAGIPDDWQIDKLNIKKILVDNCFNLDWFEKSWKTFVDYLQQFYMQQR